MGKSQAAIFVAGLIAGATPTMISSAIKDGSKIDVMSVRAAPTQLPDGGVQIQVETCGIVNKRDGNLPKRFCDQRVDARMTGLVADATDRLTEAQVKGEQREADNAAKLAVARQRQAEEAKKIRQARIDAARDAGAIIPP